MSLKWCNRNFYSENRSHPLRRLSSPLHLKLHCRFFSVIHFIHAVSFETIITNMSILKVGHSFHMDFTLEAVEVEAVVIHTSVWIWWSR